MTPAQKTVAILGLAGAVAGGTSLLAAKPADSRTAGTPITQPASPGQPGHSHGQSTASGFEVKAAIGSSYVLRGGEAHMAVTLTAPKIAGRQRPPVDIAVVMDRSGSMAGEKLENAKLAADRLLAQLGAGDRFTIVSYGTDVDVVYPLSLATEGHVTSAQRAVLSIHDDGGTNMSGGLMAARQQLGSASVSNDGRVRRIVLISDGKANEGIIGAGPLGQLSEETANAGTSLTTVGVGLDYDETVMTRMATSGRGNYYFVESAAGLQSMFASELGNLGKTTATDVAVIVRPAPGVRIVHAYGAELRANGDGGYRFAIADLYSGDTRKLVLKLQTNLPAGTDAVLSNIDVQLHSTERRTMVALSTDVHGISTDDFADVTDHRNPDAVVHIERAKTAAAINTATALYEKGDAQAARTTLVRRRQEAKKMAADTGNSDLDEELSAATQSAEGNFGSAGWGRGSVGSVKGKRARKANRYDAYKLSK